MSSKLPFPPYVRLHASTKLPVDISHHCHPSNTLHSQQSKQPAPLVFIVKRLRKESQTGRRRPFRCSTLLCGLLQPPQSREERGERRPLTVDDILGHISRQWGRYRKTAVLRRENLADAFPTAFVLAPAPFPCRREHYHETQQSRKGEGRGLVLRHSVLCTYLHQALGSWRGVVLGR